MRKKLPLTTLIRPYVSFQRNEEWKKLDLCRLITKAGGSINDNLTAVITTECRIKV